jgi:pimeloyl-ACP methyl ester carboxylesterase
MSTFHQEARSQVWRSRWKLLNWARMLAVGFMITIGTLGQASLPARAAHADPAATASSFVALLARENFAAAEQYFAPQMQSALPQTKLVAFWEAFIARLGRFVHQTITDEQNAGRIQDVTAKCIFAGGTAKLLISIDHTDKIVGLHTLSLHSSYIAPSYVRNRSFHERSVKFGRVPWILPGTVTMPTGHGPFPAVVLVPGSGPSDRDETIEGNKPFRDIAWGLASQGIAVLRYDKRTLVHGEQMLRLRSFTVQDEFVDDAVAGFRLLLHTPGIDRHAIYLLGHSEGGTLAPRIARRAPQLAGLIIMAGATRPLQDVILAQLTYLHSPGLVTDAQLAGVRQQVAEITALTPADRSDRRFLLGCPVAYWLDLQNYNPVRAAQKLTTPMLIAQGDRDYQVTLADDFRAWQQGLAGHPHVTFTHYANLFHPFISVPPGSPRGLATPAAYNHIGHVSPQVIHDLAAWMKTTRAPGASRPEDILSPALSGTGLGLLWAGKRAGRRHLVRIAPPHQVRIQHENRSLRHGTPDQHRDQRGVEQASAD